MARSCRKGLGDSLVARGFGRGLRSDYRGSCASCGTSVSVPFAYLWIAFAMNLSRVSTTSRPASVAVLCLGDTHSACDEHIAVRDRVYDKSGLLQMPSPSTTWIRPLSRVSRS
jgi:hypothetical protein